MTRQEALAVLGLSSSANLADLKTAYRRLAAKCHPDLHPNKANATQQFQRINAAHQLLKSKLPAAPKPEAKSKPRPKPKHWRSFYNIKWCVDIPEYSANSVVFPSPPCEREAFVKTLC